MTLYMISRNLIRVLKQNFSQVKIILVKKRHRENGRGWLAKRENCGIFICNILLGVYIYRYILIYYMYAIKIMHFFLYSLKKITKNSYLGAYSSNRYVSALIQMGPKKKIKDSDNLCEDLLIIYKETKYLGKMVYQDSPTVSHIFFLALVSYRLTTRSQR